MTCRVFNVVKPLPLSLHNIKHTLYWTWDAICEKRVERPKLWGQPWNLWAVLKNEQKIPFVISPSPLTRSCNTYIKFGSLVFWIRTYASMTAGLSTVSTRVNSLPLSSLYTRVIFNFFPVYTVINNRIIYYKKINQNWKVENRPHTKVRKVSKIRMLEKLSKSQSVK